jgi:hypothetical protein
MTFISMHSVIMCVVLSWRTYEMHPDLSLKSGCDSRVADGVKDDDTDVPTRLEYGVENEDASLKLWAWAWAPQLVKEGGRVADGLKDDDTDAPTGLEYGVENEDAALKLWARALQPPKEGGRACQRREGRRHIRADRAWVWRRNRGRGVKALGEGTTADEGGRSGRGHGGGWSVCGGGRLTT